MYIIKAYTEFKGLCSSIEHFFSESIIKTQIRTLLNRLHYFHIKQNIILLINNKRLVYKGKLSFIHTVKFYSPSVSTTIHYPYPFPSIFSLFGMTLANLDQLDRLYIDIHIYM